MNICFAIAHYKFFHSHRLDLAKELAKTHAVSIVTDSSNGIPQEIKYLESLEKVANGKATKIFLPADLSATLGSIGAVAELFKDDDSKESKKSTKK